MVSSVTHQQSPDVVIIGAGAVGLWTAWKAVSLGLRVLVLERSCVGAGASGGILGALMPIRPSRWTDEKQFQLDALASLEGDVAAVEQACGVACGYARCGRLMPIDTEKRLTEHRNWQEASDVHWGSAPGRWRVIDAAPEQWRGLVADAIAYDFDTLSARINPRGLIAALSAAVRAAGGTIREGCTVAGVHPDGQVQLADGSSVVAGHIVLAAGVETFGILAGLGWQDAGWGVKGQSVLLKPARPLPEDLPVLYRGGTYVVTHEGGLVAVGSTSVRSYRDVTVEPEVTARLAQEAAELCPALDGAQVLEAWAGVRPRASSRKPMLGPLPGAERIIAAAGGYKITLGIAHKMADVALTFATCGTVDLPEGFRPEPQGD